MEKGITLGHYGQQPEQGEGKRRNNCLLAQKQQMGCGNKESLQQVAFQDVQMVLNQHYINMVSYVKRWQ